MIKRVHHAAVALILLFSRAMNIRIKKITVFILLIQSFSVFANDTKTAKACQIALVGYKHYVKDVNFSERQLFSAIQKRGLADTFKAKNFVSVFPETDGELISFKNEGNALWTVRLYNEQNIYGYYSILKAELGFWISRSALGLSHPAPSDADPFYITRSAPGYHTEAHERFFNKWSPPSLQDVSVESLINLIESVPVCR